MVPVLDRAAVADSWRYNADAIALELPDSRPGQDRAAVWALLAEATEHAGRGGTEVFVRIDKAVAYADIKAAVLPARARARSGHPIGRARDRAPARYGAGHLERA